MQRISEAEFAKRTAKPANRERADTAKAKPRNTPRPTGKELVRFRGVVELQQPGTALEFGRLADVVTQNTPELAGKRVRVILEIEADAGDGVGQQVIEAVVRNMGELQFKKMEILEPRDG